LRCPFSDLWTECRIVCRGDFCHAHFEFLCGGFDPGFGYFLGWSRRDAKTHGVTGWWVVLLSNLVVGLSLALPLYLLKRVEMAQGLPAKG
jgi:hypothetical protein